MSSLEHEYRLNIVCSKCGRIRAVVFERFVVPTMPYSLYSCAMCGSSKIMQVQGPHVLEELVQLGCDEAEFHLWLLEQSRIKPSDLVHPNKYIRRYATWAR